MSEPLWHWDELVEATGGQAPRTGSNAITGISIDTRTIQPGDLFVALKDQRDGHDFVPQAFQNGAAAALVATGYQAQSGDGALIVVDDPLQGLERLGQAARARLKAQSRIVAVTGSVGKTGSKEALRACLSRLGRTHASEKSYNNHWGVPLTLARMPRDTQYGVFEIGMNHPGEIAPLSKMVRPHVALITTVAPVHLGQFASVDEIAEAKAEIFEGVEGGGTAVLNRDNDYYELLKSRAMAKGVRVLPFGKDAQAVALLVETSSDQDGSDVRALIEGTAVSYHVGVPGAHMVQNSLGVLAAVKAVGGDVAACCPALAQMQPPAGRGARRVYELPAGPLTVIDESYNANPASMRAALSVLALMRGGGIRRRIVVLGDMLELGEQAVQLHKDLLAAIEAAGVDLVFACGPLMARLYDEVAEEMQGAWTDDSAALEAAVLAVVRAGDVVMVKGSLGSKMGRIVDAIDKELKDRTT